jgi:hypothetical protein
MKHIYYSMNPNHIPRRCPTILSMSGHIRFKMGIMYRGLWICCKDKSCELVARESERQTNTSLVYQNIPVQPYIFPVFRIYARLFLSA